MRRAIAAQRITKHRPSISPYLLLAAHRAAIIEGKARTYRATTCVGYKYARSHRAARVAHHLMGSQPSSFEQGRTALHSPFAECIEAHFTEGPDTGSKPQRPGTVGAVGYQAKERGASGPG